MNQSFRVLSLNCKNEIIPNPLLRAHSIKHRKERILSYLQEIQPLCVGLQEFTDDMYQSLAPRLTQYEIFGEGRYRKHNRFNEQTAILVNTNHAEIEQAKTIWLSTNQVKYSRLSSSIMPRTCTVATIRLFESNQSFRLFNVHLDVLLPYTRHKQATILLDIIGKYYQDNPLPFIVMGDFNAHYDSKTIRMYRNNEHNFPFTMSDIYTNSQAIHKTTMHQFKKQIKESSPIDYIFVSHDFDIKQFAIVSDAALPLSDHFPILAELQLHINK